jgi:hypothetical protein
MKARKAGRGKWVRKFLSIFPLIPLYSKEYYRKIRNLLILLMQIQIYIFITQKDWHRRKKSFSFVFLQNF